jgi:hypothetical protein
MLLPLHTAATSRCSSSCGHFTPNVKLPPLHAAHLTAATSRCRHCTLPFKLQPSHAAPRAAATACCRHCTCRHITLLFKLPLLHAALRAAATARCPARDPNHSGRTTSASAHSASSTASGPGWCSRSKRLPALPPRTTWWLPASRPTTTTTSRRRLRCRRLRLGSSRRRLLPIVSSRSTSTSLAWLPSPPSPWTSARPPTRSQRLLLCLVNLPRPHRGARSSSRGKARTSPSAWRIVRTRCVVSSRRCSAAPPTWSRRRS